MQSCRSRASGLRYRVAGGFEGVNSGFKGMRVHELTAFRFVQKVVELDTWVQDILQGWV